MYSSFVEADINGYILKLENAQTDYQKAIGLMYRQNLASNSGMFFEFDKPQIVECWMKNVYVYLDMIFLIDGYVVDIIHNTYPWHIKPNLTYICSSPSNQLIETRGGLCAELEVSKEDYINLSLLSNK